MFTVNNPFRIDVGAVPPFSDAEMNRSDEVWPDVADSLTVMFTTATDPAPEPRAAPDAEIETEPAPIVAAGAPQPLVTAPVVTLATLSTVPSNRRVILNALSPWASTMFIGQATVAPAMPVRLVGIDSAYVTGGWTVTVRVASGAALPARSDTL